MKEKINDAVKRLQGLGKPDKDVAFSYQSRHQEKSLTGHVFFNTEGLISLELDHIAGYNTSYAKRSALKHLAASVLPSPKAGDTIWTLYNDGALVPNQTYTLSSETYYYGVGNSIQNCNGRQLFDEVKAIYEKSALGLCGPGMGKTFYLFKLK